MALVPIGPSSIDLGKAPQPLSGDSIRRPGQLHHVSLQPFVRHGAEILRVELIERRVQAAHGTIQ